MWRRSTHAARQQTWLADVIQTGLIRNPGDWFAAEQHARFTLPWTGRVGSEHFASCRGGVIQLHPTRLAFFERSPTSPLQGEVGECCRAECEPIIRIQYYGDHCSWIPDSPSRLPE